MHSAALVPKDAAEGTSAMSLSTMSLSIIFSQMLVVCRFPDEVAVVVSLWIWLYRQLKIDIHPQYTETAVYVNLSSSGMLGWWQE